VENGAQDRLLAFVARECGLTEEILLQRLSAILGWPFVDLPHLSMPPRPARASQPRSRFQHLVLPTALNDNVFR
jgi:hypothetical protein